MPTLIRAALRLENKPNNAMQNCKVAALVLLPDHNLIQRSSLESSFHILAWPYHSQSDPGLMVVFQPQLAHKVVMRIKLGCVPVCFPELLGGTGSYKPN